MDQAFIGWLLGGFGALMGFLLNVVWQAVKDLQTADKRLAEKGNNIEVLAAVESGSRPIPTLDKLFNSKDTELL